MGATGAVQPLIAIVISPHRNVHDGVAAALEGNEDVETLWTLSNYPEREALADLRKAAGGCVVFLDFSDPVLAKALAAEIDLSYPMANAVAVESPYHPLPLMELMQIGVRDLVKLPISAENVVAAFSSVARRLRTASAAALTDPAGALYAFLPAKPGVGATTLAAHGSAAAARASGQRTLLIDFDFRLGMTSFLFQLSGTFSVLDAIARADNDPELWDRMVCRRDMLDILGSAPVEFGGIDPEYGAVALLDMASRSYRTVCIDLPGEMREYEIETLKKCTEFFLVTTPEIGALHMARRKAEILQSLGLHSKASVIMNRVENRGGISKAEVETILQMPVRFSVSSAEKQIADATVTGKALEGNTPLVKEIGLIAQRMNPGGAPAVVTGEAKSRKFIEMFSVSRVRDRSTWGW